MPHLSRNLFTPSIGPLVGVPHPAPLVLPSGLIIREWVLENESFSEWINYTFEANKEILSYVFSAKLAKTVRATLQHEEHLSSLVEAGLDPLQDNPFLPYNGYVAAFADFFAYISRLLPEEKNEVFIATLTRTLEKRSQLALDVAEAVQNGLSIRLGRVGTGSDVNGGVNNSRH